MFIWQFIKTYLCGSLAVKGVLEWYNGVPVVVEGGHIPVAEMGPAVILLVFLSEYWEVFNLSFEFV